MKVDTEKTALERVKDRTTTLQIGLPLLVSILALVFSAFNERQRSWLEFNNERERTWVEFNKAASSYNEGRYELFRRMTANTSDPNEIKRSYAEIFPRDSISLLAEKNATASPTPTTQN